MRDNGLNAVADAFSKGQRNIRGYSTAIKFNPWVKPGVVGQGSLTMALGSVFTGNPAIMASLGAGAAVTSPRTAMYATQAAQSLWKAKDFLGQLGVKGVEQLTKDPQLTQAFLRTVQQAPAIQENVKSQLLTPVTGGR